MKGKPKRLKKLKKRVDISD